VGIKSEFKDRRKKLWNALRSGKYGKCQGRLASSENTRCVWGVAIEIAREQGWINLDFEDNDRDQRFTDPQVFDHLLGAGEYDTSPPQAVIDMFIDPELPRGTSDDGCYVGQMDIVSAMIDANDLSLSRERFEFRSFDDLANLFERWEKEDAFDNPAKAHNLSHELDTP
jgi:hypothetical protein